MNARANTKIFLITQAFKGLFLFKITGINSYVCIMKNKRHNQIKSLFIFILYKLFIMVTNNKLTYHIKHRASY